MELLKSCSQTFVTINLLSKNFQQGLVLAGAHLDMINNANVNVVMFQAPSGPCLLINTRHAGERWGPIVTKLCHLRMSTATNSSLLPPVTAAEGWKTEK